jgi:hypothetical protein
LGLTREKSAWPKFPDVLGPLPKAAMGKAHWVKEETAPEITIV